MTQQQFSHKMPIANVSVFSSTPVFQAIDYELKRIEDTRQWKNYAGVFERKVKKISYNQDRYLLTTGRW
ncbi:hypothetical protein [Candidatus Leptofilum sp.]|uniref:hypothetical protein n=1 Tax=Candidatus Leptofilum sp. TaxID=3241576 RepID=UPI003B5A90A4